MIRQRIRRSLLYVAIGLGGLVVLSAVYLGATHKAFRVPTGAMIPAIQIGDYLCAKRAGDSFVPQQGDILIFKYPKDPTIDYVKRCVALAGDTVEVVDGILKVNGETYESNFAEPDGDHSCVPQWDGQDDCPTPCSYRDHRLFISNARNRSWPGPGMPKPYIVPEGHIFMMGDNRYNSADSRYWGPLDVDLIIGKASFFYYSSEDFGRIGKKVR